MEALENFLDFSEKFDAVLKKCFDISYYDIPSPATSDGTYNETMLNIFKKASKVLFKDTVFEKGIPLQYLLQSGEDFGFAETVPKALISIIETILLPELNMTKEEVITVLYDYNRWYYHLKKDDLVELFDEDYINNCRLLGVDIVSDMDLHYFSTGLEDVRTRKDFENLVNAIFYDNPEDENETKNNP